MLEARCSTTGTTPWAAPFRAADPHKIPIDSNGNLTQKTEGSDTWTYTWNAENQFTRVERNGIEVARFVYDPNGRRVQKVAGGLTTSYTYDGTDIVRELRGSSTLKYVYGTGVDEPLAREDNGGTLTYLHADGLGSVVKRTDQTGTPCHEYRYDAWGRLELGVSEPGHSFTGREWDPEISLHYYTARYYDPKIGRFISEDPIGFLVGDNFYAYVANSPPNYTDPYGLSPAVGRVMEIIHWIRHPPRNPWDVWRQAVDRTRSRTAADFARDPSNRFNHCVLNCQLTGESWPVAGPALSAISDTIVVTGWPPPGVAWEKDPKDRQANECGRWAGRNGRSCQEVCSGMDWTK